MRAKLAMALISVLYISAGLLPGIVAGQLTPGDGPVDYGPTITTDRQKLFACYSLTEQMIEEYNRQFAIVNTDRDYYASKFRTYIAKEFGPRIKVLLAERNRLREAIRIATYSDAEWIDISNLGGVEQLAIYEELYGDRQMLKDLPTLADSDLIAEIKLIDLGDLADYSIDDPTEDFTTYSEYDEQGKITKTSTRVTAESGNQNRKYTYYVYKDKGVDYFDGDFVHQFKNYCISISWLPFAVCWGISNTDAYDMYQHNVNDCDALWWYWWENSGTAYQWIAERDGASAYVDNRSGAATGVTYYMEIERDEGVGTYGTLYAYICTNDYYSNGGDLDDILSITLHTSTKDFRYVYAMTSYDDNYTYGYFNGYVEDLDLEAGGAPPTAVPFSFGYILGG